MKEIWKPVKYNGIDYTGIYEISNLGRIRNIKFNRLLYPSDNHKKIGYHSISLYRNGKQQKARCHVLVWAAFMYEPPEGYVVHHKDSNGLNNRLDNLDCITHRCNLSIERTIKSGLPVGVDFGKWARKFRAKIRIESYNNKAVNLSYYDNPTQASEAYQIALKHIKSNPNTTKEEIQSIVSDYRESIGLKRIKSRKNK